MKLSTLNKYILQNIVSYLNPLKKLNIAKYNKKSMSSLDVTKYTYQKQYFDSIITPTLLENPSILVKNNIFDEATIKKLITDWKNETTDIFTDKNFFKEPKISKTKKLNTNITVLNIDEKNIDELKNNFLDIIELNISNINNLKLPCSILYNLESL